LANFDGATAISSNQYFGRDEEEEAARAAGMDFSDYSSIEATARDYARRLANTAGEDLENITQIAGQASEQVRNLITQYMRQ